MTRTSATVRTVPKGSLQPEDADRDRRVDGDLRRGRRAVDGPVRVLQPVAGDRHGDPLPASQAAVLGQLEQSGYARGAGRLDEHAFPPGEQLVCGEDLTV